MPRCVKGSTTAVTMWSPRKTTVMSARSRCSVALRNRGQPRCSKRARAARPRTTTALRSTRVTAPAPRVVYQRSWLFMPLHSVEAQPEFPGNFLGNGCACLLAGLVDLPRRVDQPDVAEGLGEIAQQLAAGGVDFFSQQTEIVGEADQPVEERLGAINLPGLSQAGDEPERTDDERPFLAPQPIGIQPLVVAVAQHETVLGELARDRFDGQSHARICRRK